MRTVISQTGKRFVVSISAPNRQRAEVVVRNLCAVPESGAIRRSSSYSIRPNREIATLVPGNYCYWPCGNKGGLLRHAELGCADIGLSIGTEMTQGQRCMT